MENLMARTCLLKNSQINLLIYKYLPQEIRKQIIIFVLNKKNLISLHTEWEGDLHVPFFYTQDIAMVTKELLTKYLQQIKELEFYIVDVKVTPNMKISIFVDSLDGLKIGEIAQIHKYIYPLIEKETDKFDLEVSSPGLTSPLKKWQQYLKLKEKNIQIVTTEDEVIDGKVENADEKEVKIKPKKGETLTFEYSRIRKAKQIINF